LIVVVVAGGAGTRLWPISREAHPKPFLKLHDRQSLIQKTFLRATALPQTEAILTVINRDLYFKTEDEYSVINQRAMPLIYLLEPFAKNTAPAIVAATLHIATNYGKDKQILVLPADHLIQNEDAFINAVTQAAKLADEGNLVTFGIQPDYPETGYGYIEATMSKDMHVKRFIEKPDLEQAKSFVAAGRYFWNSGMFCFRAATLLEAAQKWAPTISASMKQCLSQSATVSDHNHQIVKLDPQSFANVENISIDYAIMEKAENVAVVPCNMGWSDIGSWNAINAMQASDEHGNRVVGEVMLHDVNNCYIQSQDRLVGAVGVENLIIVDTPDALLVAQCHRAQEVRQLVQQLKKSNHHSHMYHRTVDRPWGSFTILEESNSFKIKRLEIKPGGILSLQMHHHRSEHWIVVNGVAKIVNGDMQLTLNTNESTFIPRGHKHRLENPGAVSLIIIEVQSGEYLGEDDIVRFEDVYGRA
jgi:mannose-1-phosphate guanylyltransferase / mannose-6-phosphate isomerase